MRLRTITTSALALVAACASAPKQPANDSGFAFRGDFPGPLGVQMYTFRGAFRTDVPGTMARIRALGFRDVELAGTYGMSAPRMRAMLDSTGLRAVSMHVGYDMFRDSLPQVVAQARTLGARYVGTAWVPHPAGPMTPELAHDVAANFDRWGKALKAEGLQFFYHIHGYEFRPDASGVMPMDVLMRETDPAAVKYEMDVFWISRPGQDPVVWLNRYPDRWRLLHLKDMRQGTARDVHTGSAPPDESESPIGSGIIDYRAVLRTAKRVGVEQFFIEDETRDPFTTVPVSTRWIESVKY